MEILRKNARNFASKIKKTMIAMQKADTSPFQKPVSTTGKSRGYTWNRMPDSPLSRLTVTVHTGKKKQVQAWAVYLTCFRPKPEAMRRTMQKKKPLSGR
jgi:hypothetical protein